MAASALPFAALPLSGQEACVEGRVAEVHVDNQSIFDPDSLDDGSRLLWAYQLANAVHVSTREDFIRDAILFAAGECLDPTALRESERILREYRFIAHAEITTLDPGNGERVVLVRTRDEWTTHLALNVRVEEGLRIEGASLFEHNFLGRGVSLGVFGVNRGARREVGGALEVPGVRGTGTDLFLKGSQGLVGGALRAEVTRPFRGEQPGVGVRQAVEYRSDLFPYVLARGGAFSHLTVREQARRLELSASRRRGTPGDLYVVGAGLSYERVTITAGDQVEGVYAGQFADRVGVPSSMARVVESQVTDREALRISVLAGIRQLRYDSRAGLDALTGLQDVPVGREALLVLGRSLGPTGEDRPGDVFGRVALLWGRSGGRAVGQFRVVLEGRREDGAAGAAGGWRDVLTEGHGFLYLLSERPLVPTFVLAGGLLGGWHTNAPYQLTLGGPDAMRGYRETDFPGGRKAFGTVEARFQGPELLPDLVDLGFTVFGDIGTIWKGDAPFGVDSGLRGSVGAGVRVGFPAGTSSVIRFDVALPVGPGAGASGAILRISAREWVGLGGHFRSPQVERSRRSGITGEYVGAARDGVVP